MRPVSPRPAKKHLGQNFLVDQAIVRRIVSACRVRSSDIIVEIGSGRGALTPHLAEAGAFIYAVEKDPDLARELTARFTGNDRVIVRCQDILTFDVASCGGGVKAIGNIPYNISTPIIQWLVRGRGQIHEAFLTTQMEFAERLMAEPFTKTYGALSCFLQYFADATLLFKIPAKAFRPIPKVSSACIHLRFRPPALAAVHEAHLFLVTETAFAQRRKKVSNALCQLFPRDDIRSILDQFGIDGGLRPDQLRVEDYVRLANAFTERRG